MEQRLCRDNRMITGLLVMTLILFSGWTSAWAAGPMKSETAKKYKDGELLVKFKPSVPDARKNTLHGKIRAEKIKEFPELRLHHVKLAEGLTVEDAIKLYTADPDVEYAEPNVIMSIKLTPNDRSYKDLWGLNNTGQNGGTPDADMDAPEAWDLTTGDSSVVVAVIDTGIDYTHPDLSANIWTNPNETVNGVDDDGNGYIDDIHGIDTFNHDSDPMDDYIHGTHVAGTIGAVGNNRTGVVGVNWAVKMIAIKFLGPDGSGPQSGAIEGLMYLKNLKDRGVNIVATNNSWGCTGSFCYSQALSDAIDAQRDILFAAAASNDGTDNDKASSANYPSSYYLPNIIAVAATDNKDAKAWFSNWGRHTVHAGAPGMDILSTVPGNAYELHMGTSMATPHVTGLAALIKADDATRNWAEIKNLILSGGDDVAAMNGITITGKRVNAYNSLACANRTVFSLLKYPTSLTPGTPVTLSALSINCGLSYGPVTATLSDGSLINLHDDGVSPDQAAGDGIFSASWTPAGTSESFLFSHPGGSELVIAPPLAIVTGSPLPAARKDAYYSTTLTATGGFTPYSWSIVSGSLPYGLTLSGATGAISGTPTVEGWFDFTVQVTEAAGTSVTKAVRLLVHDYLWASAYPDASAGFNAIAVDSAGNSYVAGHRGTVYPAGQDCLVAKYDASGNLIWSRIIDLGRDDDEAYDVAVDGNGNSYVVTGQLNYYMAGQLLKLDPLGNVLWTRAMGFDLNAVTTDPAGNAYVAGYDGSLQTVKYDPAGNVLMTLTYAGAKGSGVKVDGSGAIYVAGTGGGGSDQFIALKYGSSGALLWARSYDAAFYQIAEDIAVDGSGNAYLTGHSDDVDEWGNVNSIKMLTIKYDSAGNLVWTRENAEIGYGMGISVDAAGNVLATGWAGDIYAVKYDPSGNKLWSKFIDAGTSSDIALGSSGDVYVTGGAFTVKFSQPKIDLAVSALTAPASAKKGTTIQVTDTTANSGTAATGAPSTTKFYFSADAVLDATDAVLGTRGVPELAAGASSTVTTSVVIPADAARATYYIIAESDSGKTVLEASEINNALARAISIVLK